MTRLVKARALTVSFCSRNIFSYGSSVTCSDSSLCVILTADNRDSSSCETNKIDDQIETSANDISLLTHHNATNIRCFVLSSA